MANRLGTANHAAAGGPDGYRLPAGTYVKLLREQCELRAQIVPGGDFVGCRLWELSLRRDGEVKARDHGTSRPETNVETSRTAPDRVG